MKDVLRSLPEIPRLLRDHGFFHTLKLAYLKVRRELDGWRFDRKWGVNTRGIVAYPRASSNPLHLTAVRYEPTAPMMFAEVMRGTAHLRLPKTFFDMGCGKGRVLMMAALNGFDRVVGVEFDASLAEIARANVRQFLAKYPRPVDIQVVCQDAGTFRFPDRDAVVFFFNPFTESIMKKVLENVRNSVRTQKDRYILYYNPLCADLMSDPGEFTLVARNERCSVHRLVIGSDSEAEDHRNERRRSGHLP